MVASKKEKSSTNRPDSKEYRLRKTKKEMHPVELREANALPFGKAFENLHKVFCKTCVLRFPFDIRF